MLIPDCSCVIDLNNFTDCNFICSERNARNLAKKYIASFPHHKGCECLEVRTQKVWNSTGYFTIFPGNHGLRRHFHFLKMDFCVCMDFFSGNPSKLIKIFFSKKSPSNPGFNFIKTTGSPTSSMGEGKMHVYSSPMDHPDHDQDDQAS